MNKAFIGTNQDSINAVALREIILRCVGEAGWQCLRWPHDIKLRSVAEAHEDFESCMEGQAFNQVCELRWRRKRNRQSDTENYDLLLLSSQPEGNDGFVKDGQEWEFEDVEAVPYRETATQLPKKIQWPNSFDARQLGQRYFVNKETACVQFVSLRMK